MAEQSYLTDHAEACGEIAVLAWLLVEVCRLADDADGMTAGPLREEIRGIAARARAQTSVQRARQGVNGDG